MIGSCEASLRHGSVDGRHSGLAGFDNDVGRVNERGCARTRGPRARAGVSGLGEASRERQLSVEISIIITVVTKWQIRRLFTAYHRTTDRH